MASKMATHVFQPKLTIEYLALLNKTFMLLFFRCINMISNEIYTVYSEINSEWQLDNLFMQERLWL